MTLEERLAEIEAALAFVVPPLDLADLQTWTAGLARETRWLLTSLRAAAALAEAVEVHKSLEVREGHGLALSVGVNHTLHAFREATGERG